MTPQNPQMRCAILMLLPARGKVPVEVKAGHTGAVTRLGHEDHGCSQHLVPTCPRGGDRHASGRCLSRRRQAELLPHPGFTPSSGLGVLGQNSTDRGAYTQQWFINHDHASPTVLEAGSPVSGGSSWFTDGAFFPCPHMADGPRELSGAFFIRALIPFMWAPSS